MQENVLLGRFILSILSAGLSGSLFLGMFPLFKAILKFCSTHHLFIYLKRRYSANEVRQLNNLIKLKGKLRSALISYRFLKQCLHNKVVPHQIAARIAKSKAKPSLTIERVFLHDAASRALDQFSSLRNSYRSCWHTVRTFLSFFDVVRFCRYISQIDEKTFKLAQKRCDTNIDRLIKKRFGLPKLSADLVVTNLSNYSLSQAESYVLSHGLNFCIPNNNVSSETVFSEIEILLSQLDRLSPTSSRAYSALKAKLLHLAHTSCGTPISQADLANFREHVHISKQLRNNKDIIITKPDKGSGVVILNRTDYINKMSVILDDTNTFTSLGPVDTHDKTKRNETKLQDYLLGLVKKKKLTNETYKVVRPTGSQRPRLYGLPKIHKAGTPLRPILSMIGSAQHELAKWLTTILKPVLEHYSTYCIRDSFTFATYVQTLSDIDHANCFLGSFDISSLFTNVPLEETINICADFLYSEQRTNPPFSRIQFVELMNLVTSSVEFSFNNHMYRQINGVAMGSPLGPILANIFVGYHESKLFSTGHLPLAYKRYVDDTFTIFHSREDFETFLTRLNSMHASLKFTFETELDGKLPFLDVLVHKNVNHFSTSIYRKPTFTGLYTKWNSFCSPSRKLNLIKTLTHRACMICSSSHLPGEIQTIKKIFLDNGYPAHVVSTCISNKLSSLSAERRFGPQKCPVYVRLPWKGQISLQLERQIKSVVSDCFKAADLRVIHVTRSLLSPCYKDVLPSNSLNNVIYKYKCRCDAVYVGRTSQRLNDRIKQHVPQSLLSYTSNLSRPISPNNKTLKSSRSAIGQHLLDSPSCADNFSFERFTILDRARNNLQLHVLEAWHIHFRKPVLCKQKELVYKLKLLC